MPGPAVTGDLTLHGVTKPVTLHVTFIGKGPGMGGGITTGWEATGSLKRSDYGLTWSKTIEGTQLVGDDVERHLQLESGEVGPDAEVGAASAEGDVGVRGAADVEAPGIVEHLLVEVGRGEVKAHPLALTHKLPGDFGVLGGRALEDHGGRGPAQDLVDGGDGTF